MKVAIKNKRELTYIDADQLLVAENMTVKDLYETMLTLQHSVDNLTAVLREHVLVRTDKDYIMEVDNKLKRIKRLKLYDVPPNAIDLHFYTVKDGQLVIDKNKIGGAL